MPTPVVLPQFTARQFIEEAQTPDSNAPGDPVNFQPLNILVTFTPSVAEIQVSTGTPPFTVYLDPIVARVDTDGLLKGINSNPAYYLDPDGTTIHPVPTLSAQGNPVHAVFAGSDVPAYWIDDEGNQVANPAGTPEFGARLVQNAAILGLSAPLTYKVTYHAGSVVIQPFRFAAPATDSVIDLSTVSRLPL
jgi:hypothetical protein